MKPLFILLFVIFISFASAAVIIETEDETSVTVTTGNLTDFTDLEDTPASYTGEGTKCVKVNAGETALEFGVCAAGGGDQYDQSLNTTDSVTFVTVNATNWLNVSITESQISDLGEYAPNTTFGIQELINDSHISLADINVTDQSNISVTGDNSSWNETYADTLYSPNTSFAISQFINNSHIQLSSLNLTDWSNATGTGDNSSWNQSHANTLYVPNTTLGIQQLINNTVLGLIRLNITDWTNITITESQISDLSHTTDTNVTTECSSDEVLLGNASCISISTFSGDNTSWNESYADTLYAGIEWDYNQSTATFNMYNDTWATDTDTNTQKTTTGFYLYNDSTTIYLNETQLNDTIDDRASGLGDNSSWNESHANTLYAKNTTLSISQLINDSHISLANINISDQSNISSIGDNSSWNQSHANSLYAPNTTFGIQQLINNTFLFLSNLNLTSWLNVTITESQISDLSHTTDTSAYVNCTGPYVFLGNGSCYNSSRWLTSSDADTLMKTSGSYLYNDSDTHYFNETQLNNTIDDRAGGDNSSWNESYANTLYAKNTTLNIQQLINNTNLSLKSVNSSEWFNVSITESQISDLTHTTDTNCTDGSCATIFYWANESALNETTLALSINTTPNIQNLINNSHLLLSNLNVSNWDNASILDTTCDGGGCDTLYAANESILNVNSSDHWDNSDTFNTTQMESVGGVLTILQSWLEGLFISDSDESNLNVNQSDFWDNLDSPLAAWIDTYNATYDAKVSFPGWTNVAWQNQSNTFTENQQFDGDVNASNFTIGGCSEEWNGTCAIKTCPTTVFIMC